MNRFVNIPQSAFKAFGIDAGFLLKQFNPDAPAIAPADIITLTTGGINAVCQPTFEDFGSDVDGVPNDLMELKQITGWLCTLTVSALTLNEAFIKYSLGAADTDSQTGAINPRSEVQLSDFGGVWFVGRKVGGGYVAINVDNALSTAGFTLQTTKNGKSTIAVTITGHVSATNMNKVPMTFYTSDEASDAHSITEMLTHVTSDNTEVSVADEGEFEATYTADTGYAVSNVIVMMGGEDVTTTAYTSATGVVSIASVTGDITVIATATVAN